MFKKYTIEELVDIVNNKIDKEMAGLNTDGRISNQISIRKVRDMLTKKLLASPVKEGNQNYFDDSHVEQLFNYKRLQKDGVSEKLLKNLTEVTSNDSNVDLKSDDLMQAQALNVLSSIQARGYASSADIKLNSISKSPQIDLPILGSLESSVKYQDSYRSGMKVVNEYPLDSSGKIQLKMEQGYTPQNKEEVLERIKQILGIGDKS